MIYEAAFSVLNFSLCAVMPNQQIWCHSLAGKLADRTEGNSRRKLLKTTMKLEMNREHDHSVCVIAQTETLVHFCYFEIADVETIHDLCLHSLICYHWPGHSMETVL